MAPARRATANVDAPVWKSYVAARIEAGAGSSSSSKATAAITRTRKRVKPTSTDVAVPPSSGVGFQAKHQLATRASVRAFWEALTVAERLQILMVDDPDIVKQLYKLNLSLLCVGLMQRHLKAGTVRAVSAASSATSAASRPTALASTTSAVAASEKEAPAAISTGEPLSAITKTTTAEVAGEASVASDSERTYDLLEAMEFMDIGTGILTVKTELVEDVDHMFSLVTAVLHGFLVSIHVLSESQFRDLFVAESEVINTWEDYERLIAMLVEQLMLRSYVTHLEKQATQQMEALLLEASLEDKPGSKAAATSGTSASSQKKKKKKKKSKSKATTKFVSSVVEPAESMEMEMELEEENLIYDEPLESDSEPEQEDTTNTIVVEDFTCQSECSTEDADLSGPSSPVKSIAKALNRLNPHARAFEPSLVAPIDELRSPTSGKRKLDDFIIHIPWQDLVNEVDDEDVVAEGALEVFSGELGCRRPREKYRRRDEEDAELEWHLQHIYASTSSIFGWDFNEQREIAPLPADPWVDASLWRTDPREVVRYYFPPGDHASAFASAAFPPPGSAAAAPPSAATHASRYYFTPSDPHTPLAPSTSSSSPRAAASTVAASMFRPFMPPPNGAPVSFWREPTAHSPAAAYPPVFEAQPYPKFRPTKSPSRRGKLSSNAHATERR